MEFGNPLAVVDLASGNGIDYTYTHILPPSFTSSGIQIHQAALTLTHSGNLDDGPIREVWKLFTAGGLEIGKLRESESGIVNDRFELSGGMLNELKSQDPWKLNVGLSEQTSFNQEKLELYKSELTLDYSLVAAVPPMPEPASGLLLAGGLVIGKLMRRKKAAGNPLEMREDDL